MPTISRPQIYSMPVKNFGPWLLLCVGERSTIRAILKLLLDIRSIMAVSASEEGFVRYLCRQVASYEYQIRAAIELAWDEEDVGKIGNVADTRPEKNGENL